MPVKVGLHYIDIWNESMEDEVRAYEKEPVLQDQIVFYGPSYFTRWSTRFGMVPMREALTAPDGTQCVVNRGFGSSCSEHQLYYYPRMIRPLAPRALVYSSYANAQAFGYTVEEIWELAQRVIAWARTDFPGIRIYLCGTNPSRDETEKARALALRYDEWLKEFAASHENCFFVDIRSCAELRRKDIFVEDGVHYNQEGYRLYEAFFRQALKDELAQYGR